MTFIFFVKETSGSKLCKIVVYLHTNKQSELYSILLWLILLHEITFVMASSVAN